MFAYLESQSFPTGYSKQIFLALFLSWNWALERTSWLHQDCEWPRSTSMESLSWCFWATPSSPPGSGFCELQWRKCRPGDLLSDMVIFDGESSNTFKNIFLKEKCVSSFISLSICSSKFCEAINMCQTRCKEWGRNGTSDDLPLRKSQ